MIILDDNESPQGNWLIAHIKNSRVAAIVSEHILCRIGMHQGTWTTEGCQQNRFCMYCGKPQHQEQHTWSGPYYPWENIPHIWYVQCRNCGKTAGTALEVKRPDTSGRQEMSQEHSSMFSDAAYLFGTTFSPTPSWGTYKEELPDGTQVSQKTLAEQVVLAAFAYLYKEKLIDIVHGNREYLFLFEKTTAIVKKLPPTAHDLSGLEAVIFSSLQDNSHMYGLTRGLIVGLSSSNPWRDVLNIVKENLLRRGMLKRVEEGKVLFISTHKYVVNGDISQEEKQIAELKKTLEKIQAQGELYQQMLSDIHDGIYSRYDTD
jgi:hypothetical protein